MEINNWRERWAGKVLTPDDMVSFVDAVGCCSSKPMLRYLDFPNQSEVLHNEATAVWFWKDDLHTEKRLYYTRVLGGNPGFISNALLPAFIATNGAVADELLYTGVMSPESRQIYQVILERGPIPIKDLKRFLSADAKRAANRVLQELETKFIITKTGITGRTRGTYGYIWDLVERWMPEMLSTADELGSSKAKAVLTEHFSALGIPPESDFFAKVLGWTR